MEPNHKGLIDAMQKPELVSIQADMKLMEEVRKRNAKRLAYEEELGVFEDRHLVAGLDQGCSPILHGQDAARRYGSIHGTRC